MENGPKLHFLTPGKKPQLKTSVTKPQNVFMDSLSPVLRRSISGASGTTGNFDNVYKAGFEKWTGMRDASHLESKGTTVADQVRKDHVTPSYMEIDKDRKTAQTDLSVKKSGQRSVKNEFKTDHLAGIEVQVISENPVINDANYNSNSKDPTSMGQYLGQSSNFMPDMPATAVQTDQKNETETKKHRAYTSSYCSSCNSEDSVIAQSRCSVCDGCSSGTSCSIFSQTLSTDAPKLDVEDESNMYSRSPLEMSPRKLEELLDAHMTYDQLSPNNWSQTHVRRNLTASKDGGVDALENRILPSKEQLTFLMLRMILANYKGLTESLASERKISKSQQRTITCLIQAVVLLSRKVKVTSEQFHKTQAELKQIQRRQTFLQSHQKKLYISICVLVVYNICSMGPVRDKLKSVLKFFGIVENMRKINRTRKMIAENWRNIPSLLTDFWRIFIFRSRPELKRS